MTDRHPADTTLVRRFRAGDDRAFDILHARYRPSLLRFAERLLGPARAAAEDVVQDSFVRAYRALRADDRDVAPAPWLRRIVHNRAMDELRRPRMLALDETPSAHARLRSDDAAAVAQRRERLRLVVGDIATLPPRQREALVGHVVQGTPHADLARALDTSVPATKNLINRARTSLLEREHARIAA
jgi:RNA polymerase sigma factor (sigma-70 family)